MNLEKKPTTWRFNGETQWLENIIVLEEKKSCPTVKLHFCYVTYNLCHITYKYFYITCHGYHVPWIIWLYNMFMSYITNLLTCDLTNYIPCISCYIRMVIHKHKICVIKHTPTSRYEGGLSPNEQVGQWNPHSVIILKQALKTLDCQTRSVLQSQPNLKNSNSLRHHNLIIYDIIIRPKHAWHHGIDSNHEIIGTIKEEVSSSFNATTFQEQLPRSHHKGATGRVRTGDRLYPVLRQCHCQLGYPLTFPIENVKLRRTLTSSCLFVSVKKFLGAITMP